MKWSQKISLLIGGIGTLALAFALRHLWSYTYPFSYQGAASGAKYGLAASIACFIAPIFSLIFGTTVTKKWKLMHLVAPVTVLIGTACIILVTFVVLGISGYDWGTVCLDDGICGKGQNLFVFALTSLGGIALVVLIVSFLTGPLASKLFSRLEK